MDSRPTTGDPVETSEEREHHEAGPSSEQPAPMSQGAPQSAPLPEEAGQGPYQQPLHLGPSRPLQVPAPTARHALNLTFGHAEKPEIEAASSTYRGDPVEVPPDGRVSRYATMRKPVSGVYTGQSAARRSTIDYLVPVEQQTVSQRLEATLKHARSEREKFNLRANGAKWSINVASGVQVFLGALTTGLAAMRLDGKQLGIATTVLGILTTLAGAFLTKVRAGGEPETSTIQAHDLNQFVRKCEAFQIDHGHEVGDRHNDEIKQYRDDLELILRQKQIDEAA